VLSDYSHPQATHHLLMNMFASSRGTGLAMTTVSRTVIARRNDEAICNEREEERGGTGDKGRGTRYRGQETRGELPAQIMINVHV
jgi:hypothetical protein